jgi:ATP-dependent helicase/nuclease subunit A
MERAMNAPAYQADGAPVSREAFYTIACDPQRSVVVEACAGAGKTWMLVSRIVRALLDGARPQEILAITFTRKAAGEMRERLNQWLADFASPLVDDTKRAAELVARGVPPAQAAGLAARLAGLHEQVLATGRPVEIRTFHAWFSQLLKTAPLDLLAELGLQPGMSLIEDIDEHLGEIFRRFHAALLDDDALHADYRALIERRGRSQTAKWLATVLDKRVEIELADEAGVLDESVPSAAQLWPALAALPHPAHRLNDAAARALLLRVAAALGAQTKATPRKQGSLLEQALALDEPETALNAARSALLNSSGQLRAHLAAEELDDAVALLDAIHHATRQQTAHDEHLRMARLSRVLLAQFAAFKRLRGLADMADLERCALALLRDADLSGWVQERLDSRVRHVLIDEFQDTSPLQWHALHSWLSAYAGAGGGASGQRPPSVFIVGDPKQSIYRFRRAEPRVFAAAAEFVADGLGGHVLACDHTRRNAPEVIAALNQVFEAAQREGDYSDFRAHSTEIAPIAGAGLRALPPVPRPPRESAARHEGTLLWRDSLVTPRHEPEEVLREQEAHWVAQAAGELVGSGAFAPGEIFVLCRKRASLRLVAQALQARHLPAAAVEDQSLMDAPEVRDLIAMLDALASPQHRLSLAQALRSPLFGAGDGELIALAQQVADGGDWFGALLAGPHDGHPALQRAQRLLPAWLQAARELPPHDLLDRIVAESGYRERVAATVPPEQRAAALNAIDALLGQALTLDGARYATPYNFVRALKRRALKVAPPAQRNAVQLLTVHGAKGLEARVVFIMDSAPERSGTDTATVLVDWPVELDRPARCAFVYSEGDVPPSLALAMGAELAARQREELNGLYVAMTRAREQVVFSRTEPHIAAPGASWWQRVDALARAWLPADVASAEAGQGAFALPALPALPPAPVAGLAPMAFAARDDRASRLGQAVHRTLEWATAERATGSVDDAALEALATAAASAFDSPPREVLRIASTMLKHASGRRFFDRTGLLWAGNEVAVAQGAQPLRIDRLVALDEGGERVWWVLDYKLAHKPQAQQEYQQQMQRYRDAVQALQPGERVRCALIAGTGEVVELDI